MLSRFHLIPERNGRTDGRTDRRTNRRMDGQICYINIARQYADAPRAIKTTLMNVKKLPLRSKAHNKVTRIK